MKMIRCGILAAFATFAISAPALAADLRPAPRPVTAAPAPARVVDYWTGFRLGVTGGWGWNDQDSVNVVPTNANAVAIAGFRAREGKRRGDRRLDRL